MKTLGVIGTAKNTGKTTTLSFLLKGLISRGLRLSVTSIGYDGEEFDNITKLPKPRLYLEKDCIIATSEKCLMNTKAEFEIIDDAPFSTALGKIKIVRITKPGLIVLAGPNTKNGLNEIIKIIEKKTKCDLLLVDGSLNRLSPMFILDKLIITTGASRNPDIGTLVKEMSLIEKIFSYQFSSYQFTQNNISIISSDKSIVLRGNTLVDEYDFQQLEKSLDEDVEKIFIPGLISAEYLSKNLDRIYKTINKSFELVFHSPIQLLLTEELKNIEIFLNYIKQHQIKISYRFKPCLSAITINPFYPKQQNYVYVPSYLDKEILFKEMSKELNTPVFNIFETNSNKIFDLI